MSTMRVAYTSLLLIEPAKAAAATDVAMSGRGTDKPHATLARAAYQPGFKLPYMGSDGAIAT